MRTWTKTLEVLLWVVQGLLALLFGFAGGMKLVVPLEVLTEQSTLPGLFLRFIGLAELLGALGLILPGLLRLWTFLTSWAAAGLVVIMLGATVITFAAGGLVSAAIPLAVGLCSALVAHARASAPPRRAVAGMYN